MYSQLPESVQNSLYLNFLHQDFIQKFRDFFRLKKTHGICPIQKLDANGNLREETANFCKAYFDWTDLDYRKFMLQMCSLMEPRFETEDVYILDEFDEAQEIIFI